MRNFPPTLEFDVNAFSFLSLSPATSAVRIQFRYPDGRTQVSSFSPSDPLQRLYDFAGEVRMDESRLLVASGELTQPSRSCFSCIFMFITKSLLQSWTMRGSFSLSVAFPRRQLDAESRETTLEVIGDVVPSATVLVLPSAGSTSSSSSGCVRGQCVNRLFWN